MLISDDKVQIDFIRTRETTKLRVLGHPYGQEFAVSLSDLRRLTRYLESVIAEWQRDCPAPAVDYYAVLGIVREASTEEIREAYRTRAKAFHPDTSGQETGAAMAKLNEAYAVLGDPQQRRQYDDRLTREGLVPAGL